MKNYIKPTSIEFDVQSEGVIATSLPMGETPGNQQLSNRNEGWNCEDWSVNEE